MTMDISLFQKSEIFRDLDDEEIEGVAEICEVLKMKHDEYVFREGDEGDRLYIIASGAVRISRDVPGTGEEALTILREGACFGEMAVFDSLDRSTDAIVHSKCTLLTVTRSNFQLMLDSDRELAYKVLWSIVRLLSKRLRATNDNLRSILVMAMF